MGRAISDFAISMQHGSVDAFLVAADLAKRIELALKKRSNLEARERNNLKFYCLRWVACVQCRSVNVSATKLADIKGLVSEASIEKAIDEVNKLFSLAGGTDQVAKGTDFKNTLNTIIQEEIRNIHTGSTVGTE
jgi:hypothetical protein